MAPPAPVAELPVTAQSMSVSASSVLAIPPNWTDLPLAIVIPVSWTGWFVAGVFTLKTRTALLPRISLREPRSVIGKSTDQAMLAGAVLGYRGLVREILQRIISEKGWQSRVRVVATGGYARLIARKLPEVDIVHENLTLEGLRLVGCMNSHV